jgi:hypothetical protein
MIGHSKIHNLFYVKVFLTKFLGLALFFFHVSYINPYKLFGLKMKI